MLSEETLPISQRRSWVHAESLYMVLSESSTGEYCLGQSKLEHAMWQHWASLHLIFFSFDFRGEGNQIEPVRGVDGVAVTIS